MRALHQTLTRPLVLAGALVATAGLAIELVHTGSYAPLVALLSLSYEANVPTWYASSLLLACGIALWAIASDVARRGGPHRVRWRGLAVGFVYMSLDEAIEIHEHLGGLSGGDGVLYFDWVIPAAILVAAVGALYLPFLRDLPRRRRRQFVAAGAVYVAGAVLTELPLGWWTDHAGAENPVYALIDWVEESLELAGATLFLLALAERWDDRERASP